MPTIDLGEHKFTISLVLIALVAADSELDMANNLSDFARADAGNAFQCVGALAVARLEVEGADRLEQVVVYELATRLHV